MEKKNYIFIVLSIFCFLFVCSCNPDVTPTTPKEKSTSLFSFVGNKDYVSPNNVSISDAQNQMSGLEKNWWTKTGFYHIWIKSFYDSDGDGCGDLKGIEQKLDYIKDSVGCDGIWLSPFVECDGKSKDIGVNMHGYDASDYYSVNSYFGTEDDLVSLINACHNKGMKIIFDFVPNHTGRTNQWFKDSVAGKNGKSSWYLWSKKPLGWNPGMGTSDTWFKESNGKYFYGAFGSVMPDLNYYNYEVREEMTNVVRYWLNKGFDGLRIDAARYLIEEEELYADTNSTHKWFQSLRAEIDKYSSPKFMVAEAWVLARETLDTYFGNADEFNMVLDFNVGKPIIESVKTTGRDSISVNSLVANLSVDKSYGVFLSNHDEYTDRPGYTLGQDSRRMGQALALSIIRPNVPFIYYGNEVGLTITSYDGDIRLRGPFNWDLVEAQKDDVGSSLNFAKNLLGFRKLFPDLFAGGTVKKLTSCSGTGVVAYIVEDSTNKFLCVYNLNNKGKEQVVFSGLQGYNLSEYSCLIGRATSTIDASTDTDLVIVNQLSARAVRVYALGQSGMSNYWDNELEFSTDNAYKAKNDTSKEIYPSSSMFLRGTMNDWGGEPMTKSTSGTDTIWTCTYTFASAANIKFKFCANDGDPWAANWGTKDNKDLSANVEKGTYLFTFNESSSSKGSNGAVYTIVKQ